KNNDLRPVFICEDGKDIELTDWNIPATSGAEAIIRLKNVQGAKITNNDIKQSDAGSFVLIEGESNETIRVEINKTPGIKKMTEVTEVAPLWKDFLEAKKKGTTPVLPDFSYAGYHFSEKEIPSV